MSRSLSTDGLAMFDMHESVVRSYCRHFPKVFAQASGSIVTDESGKSYIDFLAGCGALNYGHNEPMMKAALLDHITRDGIGMGLDFHTTAKRDFLAAFHDLILAPRGLDYRLQFTGPTGTNAVEAALKLARKATGRTNVIAFTNGFHGVSLGALAVTGNRRNRMGVEIPLPGVARMPYDGYLGDAFDSADLLDAMLTDPSGGIDPPAAVILETVQGEGGLNVASPVWLRRVAEIARRHGALLIVDDVQAGCGRTGSFFSFDGTGVVPDIVTLSKSLSGFGLPMSLVLMRPEHDVWEPGEHNGTFRGNNHAFVTARVAIETFWATDVFEVAVARKAEIVRDRLVALSRLVPGSRLKGRSMMQGLDTGSGELAGEVCARAFDEGLIIETSGPRGEVLKILAALTTPDDLLHRGFDILARAVDATFASQQIAAQ